MIENITIDMNSWEFAANQMTEAEVTNAQFLMKFCNALDSSLDQAMQIIFIGFIISSVVSWAFGLYDWSKLAKTESEWINKSIIEIPKMVQNIGHVLIFVGVVYMGFIRAGAM